MLLLGVHKPINTVFAEHESGAFLTDVGFGADSRLKKALHVVLAPLWLLRSRAHPRLEIVELPFKFMRVDPRLNHIKLHLHLIYKKSVKPYYLLNLSYYFVSPFLLLTVPNSFYVTFV